ncbi:hypothetical protein STEG23_024317 [Scotinomys teguina]
MDFGYQVKIHARVLKKNPVAMARRSSEVHIVFGLDGCLNFSKCLEEDSDWENLGLHNKETECSRKQTDILEKSDNIVDSSFSSMPHVQPTNKSSWPHFRQFSSSDYGKLRKLTMVSHPLI